MIYVVDHMGRHFQRWNGLLIYNLNIRFSCSAYIFILSVDWVLFLSHGSLLDVKAQVPQRDFFFNLKTNTEAFHVWQLIKVEAMEL